ncbi:MAG: glycosyltransferase family 1 protein [Desulfitobacterium hafniense]|nr:glycosyltransferase family 1 protein [Desulfitobacterium hafniense]
MPTIIYPPSIPWNWMFQRPQQLMRQLSTLGYHVLYEDLGHFSHPTVQKLSSTFSLCQGISPLSISHPRPRILWLTVPSHINLIEHYAPDLVIYDAVDEPKDEFSSWAPYYPDILKKADLIFASGKSIYEYLSANHPNVHLVPNGVDYHHFASALPPRPADLPTGKPIVGYSGAIAPWLDWDLLTHVIKSNPDFSFVFLGTLFQMGKFPLKNPNIKYIGLKPYNQLPAYLHQFAVGLIPFRLSQMTKGCNPIKLYEYYAAGIPVMGTPLPELLNVPKIHLESDPNLFSLRLRQIIRYKDACKTERLAYAQANDWTVRAGLIRNYIDETFNKIAKPACNNLV